MDDSLEEPWGLLVAKEGSEDERVPLIGQEFIIGRAKGNASLTHHRFYIDSVIIYACTMYYDFLTSHS